MESKYRYLALPANANTVAIKNEERVIFRYLERHIRRQIPRSPSHMKAHWLRGLDEIKNHPQYAPIETWEDRLPY